MEVGVTKLTIGFVAWVTMYAKICGKVRTTFSKVVLRFWGTTSMQRDLGDLVFSHVGKALLLFL